MRRQAAGFQSDHVGDFHSGQRFSPAHHVAGAEDLKIVGGGVARQAQIALALAENLMEDRRRQTIGPEAADGQIVAVANQPRDSISHRRQLVGQGSRLARKKCPRSVGARVGKKLAVALGEDVHGSSG